MKISKNASRKLLIVSALLLAVVITLTIVSTNYINTIKANSEVEEETEPVTEKATEIDTTKHMIPGAEKKVLVQSVLEAGCETYAATMLFHILGFDLSEIDFADNYLDCHPVMGDMETGLTGPDMYSGFAGTAYAGWGVYAPSMAKSMNKYLKDQKSELKAYNYENISLEKLCEEYIDKDIPVMVWATTNMEEPTVHTTWKVDYVDENAKTKIGDDFSWYEHEHCLVLIGYDEKYYYFDDSAYGDVSHFEKALVAKRYKQLGSQCIIVK